MLVLPDVDGGHGRIEKRIATVSHDVGWLRERHGWPGLKAIGMIETCHYRVKTPQKRRSKIPQFGGCEFVPGGMPPGTKAVQNPIRFFSPKEARVG